MRNWTIFFAAGVVLWPVLAALAAEPQRTIVLSTCNWPYVFSEQIPIAVSYHNREDSPWEIPTPTESVAVSFRYRPTGTDQHPNGHSLAKRDSVACSTSPPGPSVAPIAKPLKIATGETHAFLVILEPDWTGHLRPGSWTVWLEDGNLNLESKRIEIQLHFTAESLKTCLAIARDKEQNHSNRKWHAEWLQKVVPDLQLQWWHNNTPAEEQAARETEVQRRLKDCESFLDDPKNAPAIKAAMARINRNAGLKDEPK